MAPIFTSRSRRSTQLWVVSKSRRPPTTRCGQIEMGMLGERTEDALELWVGFGRPARESLQDQERRVAQGRLPLHGAKRADLARSEGEAHSRMDARPP